MYRCLCGAAFERPAIRQETDHYGCGISRHMKYLLCPACGLGEQYFEEITEKEVSTCQRQIHSTLRVI